MNESETERLRLERDLQAVIENQGGTFPRRLLYAMFVLNLLVAVILVSVAVSNREVLHVLADCVEPSTDAERHECNERGRRQTAEAVGQIIDANDNGKLDSQELLDALERVEALLREGSPTAGG